MRRFRVGIFAPQCADTSILLAQGVRAVARGHQGVPREVSGEMIRPPSRRISSVFRLYRVVATVVRASRSLDRKCYGV